jgi:hypothetical protein
VKIARLWCVVAGHDYRARNYDGRGRRITITKCERCAKIDHAQTRIVPLNRQVRRRWARDAARKVARA